MTNQLEAKTKQIIDVVSQHDFNSLSLLSGDTGSLFLLSYYAEYTKEDRYLEMVEEKIMKMYEKIQESGGHIDCGYSNGISGFLWALNNLNKSGHIDVDLKENFADALPLIYDYMFSKINEGNFDFFHGALGSANLLLDTIDLFPDNTIALRDFNTMLLQIGMVNEEQNTLYYASSVLRANNEPKMVINLSYSHGMAAILYYFIRCMQNEDLATPEIKLGIERMVRFFRNNQNIPSAEMSYFPSWVNIENHVQHNSRLAWCYGDLGIGIVLYQAGELVNDSELMDYALTVLKHTTTRTNPTKENVVEGNFCHGSAGLVQTYRTIYELTKEKIFLEAADYWLQVTVDLAVHEEGYAGYKTYHGRDNIYVNDCSLLEGAAGVAIVFLETLMEKSLPWKQSLML